MRTPERPFDGEASGDGAPSYEWLDEWLCEYVDGTMDPSMEAVFEQYVEADPELKAHVERLRQTREILCGCDVPERSPTEGPAPMNGGGEEDLIQAPPVFSEETGERSVASVGIASSIAVALVVGFLAGSVLVDPSTFSSTPRAAAVEAEGPEASVRNEAPPRPGRTTPALRSQASSVSGEGVFRSESPTTTTDADTAGFPSAITTIGGR